MGNERKPMWDIRQSADAPNTLKLYIYGEVEGDYYDWWNGKEVVSDTSANAFREALSAYPDATEIEIYINSYGGSVLEGTAIYNQLKRHPAHKTVYVDGFACSIASVIAMAGDRIIMPRNTLMMIHNMSMSAYGTAAEIRKCADDLDTINAAGRAAYLAKAGEKLGEDKLTSMMDEETWLTAEDCITLGLADEYADKDADLSAAKDIMQKVNLTLEQRVAWHRELTARLRELNDPEPAPEPKPEPEPAPENNVENFLKALSERGKE